MAQSGDFTYTESGGNATITAYTGAGGAVTIPSTLDTYPVIELGQDSFSNSSTITSVNIPDSVVTIGASAFQTCSSLSSVILGEGVVHIGNYSFGSCALTAITIPASVTDIGIYAFQGSSDTMVFTFLGLSAPSVGGATWIDGIENGVGHAYETSNFPPTGDVWNGLMMGDYIVQEWTYTIESGEATITGYGGIGGIVTTPSTFEGYPVTEISVGTFESNTNITSLIISEGVTHIGESACGSCSVLATVSIPNTVVTISDQAFQTCSALSSVSLGEGVATIGDMAFFECTNLTSIILPNSVTSIGQEAFQGCSGMEYITFGSGNIDIGDMAFARCSAVTSIEVGIGITTIGDQAFVECVNLASVVIGDGVTAIGAYAFSYCAQLSSVILGAGITTLNEYTFDSCASLKTINIPSGITTIGDAVFGGCSTLENISFLGMVAPTSVGIDWITATSPTILGHAYAASNFPAPLSTWNGLTMGDYIPVPPPAPTDLHIQLEKNGAIDLEWTAAAGADYYHVYQDDVILDMNVRVGTSTEITTLNNGTTYRFTVAGVSTLGGEGAPSNEVSGKPYTVPGVPLELMVSYQSETINIMFAAPDFDGGSEIDYYHIYRDGILTGTAYTPGVTFTFAGMVNGQNYLIKMNAHNFAGDGPATDEVSITPSGLAGAPTDFSAIAGDAEVTLHWDAPAITGGTEIRSYTVCYGPGADPVSNPTTLGIDESITGLINGDTYYFRVRAINYNGGGAYSSNITATPSTVPDAPSILNTASGNTQITLSWEAPLDGGSEITGYKLYYGTEAAPTSPGTALNTDTTAVITSLTNGTIYYIRLKAVNGNGDSVYSNEVNATPYTVPGVPTALTLTPGDTQIKLDWTAPTSTGGNAIDYYVVYQDGVALAYHPTTNTRTIGGLTNGQTYTFEVLAHNAAGNGAKSTSASDAPYEHGNVTLKTATNDTQYICGALNTLIFNISSGTYVAGGVTLELPDGLYAIGALAVLTGTPIVESAYVAVSISDGVPTLKVYSSSLAEAVAHPVLVDIAVLAVRG